MPRRHPLAVSEIRAAVHTQAEIIDGGEAVPRLHALIHKYVVASGTFTSPKVLAKLQRQIFEVMAREIIPLVQAAGAISAEPILGERGVAAAKLRPAALRRLRRATKADLTVFRAMIDAAGTEFTAEMDVAFAQGLRTGTGRRAVVDMAQKASRAELASLADAEHKIDAAADALKAARTAKARTEAREALRRAKRSLAGRKSFLARFETKVQAASRDTIRRQAYEAQEAQFVNAGFGPNAKYTWISVGEGSCPDCLALHGETRTLTAWSGKRPGDGGTVCGGSCRCQLIPNEYTEGNPGLAAPIPGPEPVMVKRRTTS